MNPSDDLDHAISAASLVLAVLAALYTLWLGEVGKALDLEPATDPRDRGPQKDQVRSALVTKALPLFGSTLAAVCVMAWRTWLIVVEVFAHWREWAYDDVKAFFILTFVLLLILLGAATAQAWKLTKKGDELKG